MINEIKKGDYLRCIKEYYTLNGNFGVGGFSVILGISDTYIEVDGGMCIQRSKLNEHFVIDNENHPYTTSIYLEDSKVPHATITLPTYYNNDNGSLYLIAEQRGWGVRLFDLVKRLERGGKKDPLPQEIQKSIGVLQLWLEETK